MKHCLVFCAALLICFAGTAAGANIVQSGQITVDLDKLNKAPITTIKNTSASRGELLINPGFETGALPPWTTNNWTITTASPHSGAYCATDIGNFWIRQDFSSAIDVKDIKSITLWVRQPEEAIMAVDMMYSDGTYFEDLIWPKANWQQFDVTSWLTPGKKLAGIRIYGYSGGGPAPDESYIDDISILTKDGGLKCDVTTIPEAGGQANFALDAGMANANRYYLIFGGLTGTSPGTPLPGGYVTLPINWDIFTNICIEMANTTIFQNFMGVLDSQGASSAQMNLPPIPGTAGIQVYFAFGLNNPWDVVSNPVMITVVP